VTTVLVVDDQDRSRDLLQRELVQAGFAVRTADDGEAGWKSFCSSDASVVLTDLQMPGCDGIELLRRIRSRSDVPVIVFSGNGSVGSASQAFKAGADDFVSSADVEIEELVALVREAAAGTPPPPNGADLETRLGGTSEAISRVRWQLAGLAPLFTPVLVTGELGSGRATAVRALHELGATSVGELQHVDAAHFVPAELPQSGAICGVHIENVEKLAAGAQQYWSKRLARDEASRLPRATRIFATTSAPLDALVRDGRFEPRLGRALLRFEVKMPSLRERHGDVQQIARDLLRRIGGSVGRPRIQLSPAALAHLEACRFPENVRGLERLLERAVAYSLGRVIRRQTLQDLMAGLESTIADMRAEQGMIERERLLEALRASGGNITRTAESLGRSRAAVYRLIAKHDVPLARRI